MLKWLRRLQAQEEGLTLIELIVVVAIIAILAFTITPRVLSALNSSRLNGARSVANEFHSALERYYANAGISGTAPSYPIGSNATFATLRTALGNTLGLTNTTENVFTDFEYDGLTTDYCLKFLAKDSATTGFKVTPSGVEESAAAPACSL